MVPGRQEVPTFPLHKKVGEARTIYPYCSRGGDLLVGTDSTGHIINSEGDPDHPNNRGALDPKSISVRQLSTSPHRQSKVMHRAPGASEWGAYGHAQEGMVCLDCHEPAVQQQMDEMVVSLTGDFDDPLGQRRHHH